MTHADGGRAHVGVRPAMVLSHAGVIRDAVLAGGGYTFQPLPMVARDIDSGLLVRSFPEWRSLTRPFFAVDLSQRQLAPKMWTFIHLLALQPPRIEGFESPAR